MHWVEYCNGTGNTYYANLRRSHGYEEPFGVKYWGLGNEMYGMWQMKHQSAQAYAEAALEYAKGMKWVDPVSYTHLEYTASKRKGSVSGRPRDSGPG